MTRIDLERWQLPVYLAAVVAGAVLGLNVPSSAAVLADALWPLIACLLFVTFLQVPLADLGATFRHRRYLGALLIGNFVAVPALVWLLSGFVPSDPSLRLGFYLVMLVPCTDWFTTFSYLGRGDGRLAVASTPILLLLQVILLPLMLALFLGPEASGSMTASPFVKAFVGMIILPLAMAFVVERAALRRPRLVRIVSVTGWLPVPMLAIVLFVIVASEVQGLEQATRDLAIVGTVFVAYLVVIPFIAVGLSRLFRLEEGARRTVIFSMGTRNSFLVLPLVLAWPGGGPIAASVIVLQSLVELCGMLVYLAAVPKWVRDGNDAETKV